MENQKFEGRVYHVNRLVGHAIEAAAATVGFTYGTVASPFSLLLGVAGKDPLRPENIRKLEGEPKDGLSDIVDRSYVIGRTIGQIATISGITYLSMTTPGGMNPFPF